MHEIVKLPSRQKSQHFDPSGFQSLHSRITTPHRGARVRFLLQMRAFGLQLDHTTRITIILPNTRVAGTPGLLGSVAQQCHWRLRLCPSWPCHPPCGLHSEAGSKMGTMVPGGTQAEQHPGGWEKLSPSPAVYQPQANSPSSLRDQNRPPVHSWTSLHRRARMSTVGIY